MSRNAASLLSDYLQHSGTTQERFASLIGVSQPTVAYYIAAKRVPTDVVKSRIRKATGGKVPVRAWPQTRPGPKPHSCKV